VKRQIRRCTVLIYVAGRISQCLVNVNVGDQKRTYYFQQEEKRFKSIFAICK
jgi:hypothetical protein